MRTFLGDHLLNDQSDVLKSLSRIPGFLPTLVSALLFALLLMFFENLPWEGRIRLLPSLAVYTLGTGLIGTVHLLSFLRGHSVPNKLDDRSFTRIQIAHSLWFLLFIGYNFLRGVL